MHASVGTHEYAECGLSGVVLVGVNVNDCPKCGKHAVSIPNIEGLHRTLARAVAEKSDRLVPQEIRFLRKQLGYSGVDFAGVMGKSPETVSRWEKTTEPLKMDSSAERLLRLMVMTRDPIQEYPLSRLSQITKHAPAPIKLSIRRERDRWASEQQATA
jgi:putative transcriptional regulator